MHVTLRVDGSECLGHKCLGQSETGSCCPGYSVNATVVLYIIQRVTKVLVYVCMCVTRERTQEVCYLVLAIMNIQSTVKPLFTRTFFTQTSFYAGFFYAKNSK